MSGDKSNGRNQYRGVQGILLLLLLIVFCISLFVGRYEISLPEGIGILGDFLTGKGVEGKDAGILINIRLPRIIMNLLVGGGLAIAGTSFQGVFQNPLVSPDVLAVSSGAAFGAVLGIMLGCSDWLITILALGIGIISLFITYGLSKLAGNKSILNLILSGMIMTAMFNALTSFMKYIADTETQLPEITYWLMGSFSGTTFNDIKVVFLPIAIGTLVLFLMRYQMNILSLGDEEAIALGVNPKKIRFLILLAATLVTAACVTATGVVGWVGLVIPHICRMLVGANHEKTVGMSFVVGAIYLMLIDTVARNAVAVEIPIGILTAILGAPFFAFVFWKTQK